MSEQEAPPRAQPNPMAYLGLFCAMAIILGLPTLTLTSGQNLSPGVQLTILIMAIILGGVIGLTANFFGLVLPSARSTPFRYTCLLSSLAVALGLPWLVMTRGNLSEWMQVVTIILAALTGGAMALVTVFFGLVIPHRQNFGGRFGKGCFGERLRERIREEHFAEGAGAGENKDRVRVKVNVEPATAADAVDGIHLQDGESQVHIDDQGVHIQDGKQSVHIDENGVRIQGQKS